MSVLDGEGPCSTIKVDENELDASNSIIKVSSITPVSRASFVLLINESAIKSEKDKLIVIPINLLLKNVSENYKWSFTNAH